MQELYPREYAARAADKLRYRYPGPGGESYMDLIMRLDSAILMLEQTRGNALVVCDRASQAWQEGMDTRYYIYGVHASMGFLVRDSTTLGPSFYLILLRILHRDYADAFQIAETHKPRNKGGPRTLASETSAASR